MNMSSVARASARRHHNPLAEEDTTHQNPLQITGVRPDYSWFARSFRQELTRDSMLPSCSNGIRCYGYGVHLACTSGL